MEPRIPTIEETPVKPRMATLLPVEKLKQLCLEQFKKYTFTEFRLQGGTDSLKALVDRCFLENGEYVKKRIVWIAENVFV
jgi:hypothetical protein